MTESNVKFSIRSLFLWVVMLIITFTLVFSSSLSMYSQIKNYRQELANQVITLAELISHNAGYYLKTMKPEEASARLKTLEAADILQNVVIYQGTPSPDGSQPSRFAEFTHSSAAPIIPPASIFNQVRHARFHEDSIDVTIPIRESGGTIGYVFVKASAASFHEMVGDAIFLNLSVMLIMLVVGLILTVKLQRFITEPIEYLAEFLQLTSRKRDYSARADSSRIKELNILSKAVNITLRRIQETIQKQQAAEEQHRELNTRLEEMVNQRTLALKDANQELIQTLEKLHQFQRQIVQNEKMASLGDMVAGVAHEVNTPIGLGVTASTMMLDRIDTIQEQFENKTLKASTMAKFLSESQENLNIIYRNLNRAAELISSFKQVAVDQTSENSRAVCVAQLINEILLSLRPRLKKVHHQIDVNVNPDLTVNTKAGPINQIIINLIMNSIIHGFEDVESGQIVISAQMMSANKLKLIYRDNGKGIPDDIRKRIFDPFVTTKRGQGGSGLGMHLVYNLVTQALNGTISLSSEEGHGVEFVIVFPVTDATAKENLNLRQ
ncbi:ATP-binding protein [Alteromonas ponticola]|uniref:histidine kinase n=1 Tax=Alteromonas aquimaris TaxID=2998417 RepID=A0ABT3PAM4_9ALTE|nr:ATP-binding protein [Alteromonas aquimaris]MCW8109822.1 ATP-binding protein [Alteromonas aquimaris]